ncbi:hypothetical protein [Streptomyces sp. NPDC088707]|uniref:hypothetical protein n=1 Tax=Streptomyces sp. NPDC088707 TaxID=3365871 RepID=UPI0037F6BB74
MPPPGPSHPNSTGHTVESYRLTWTKDGREERRVSAVSYSAAAAETYNARKKRTAAETGVSDIEIVPVKPGE